MQKNVSGQHWVVFAFDETDNTAKTGDAANITANLRIDGGAANAVDDTNPAELEGGYYIFDITQAESNGDLILICPVSSTANIQVIGVPGAVWTRPPNFPAMGIESDGDVTKVNALDGHTVQTGDSYARIGAPAGLSIAADLVVIDNFVDELESRLTALRAGYLDNLSAGGVAQAATALSTVTWTAARAGYLDELAAANVPADVDTLLTRITAARAAVLSDWINDGRLDVILDAIVIHLTDVKGAGFVGATDSNEAIRNRGDAAWTTGAGGDATEAKQDTIITHLTEVKGSGFVENTDSNEAIRNRGDAAWTTGGGLSGSNARTINIKDQSANNVVECAVEIWDSANTVFYERKTTDASGNTTHNMDDGTYTVRIHKAGYTFTDKTLVISGAGTTNYEGSTVIIGTPAADDACRVYEYCKQQAGTTPMANVKGTAQINTLPYDYSDSLHAGSIVDGTYDSSTGLLYWDLVIGSSVKFLIPSLGKDVICTIPDEVSARLTDL